MRNSIFLLLIMALMSATCNDSQKTEEKNDTENNVKNDSAKTDVQSGLKWEILVSNRQCAANQAFQAAVFNQKEFDANWDKISKNMDMFPDKPKVDFEKKFVIFISLGEINKGGHDLVIGSIEEKGDVYKVIATHTVPGKNCMSSMSIEYPYWVIAVDKVKATKAEFEISKKDKDCE